MTRGSAVRALTGAFLLAAFLSPGCSTTGHVGTKAPLDGDSGHDSGYLPDAAAGAVACSPTTCLAQGANCGTLADGCGKILMCGACTAGQACGSTTANSCGC